MWDADKRSRFAYLREKEEDQSLNAAEQAELTAMMEEIESAELAYLGPAMQRLEAECAQVETQNAALQDLIQRKQALIQRLEQILAEANAEEDAIQKELGRILTGGASAPS
jgi:hypothetical protein